MKLNKNDNMIDEKTTQELYNRYITQQCKNVIIWTNSLWNQLIKMWEEDVETNKRFAKKQATSITKDMTKRPFFSFQDQQIDTDKILNSNLFKQLDTKLQQQFKEKVYEHKKNLQTQERLLQELEKHNETLRNLPPTIRQQYWDTYNQLYSNKQKT